jgi:hypothetical protein
MTRPETCSHASPGCVSHGLRSNFPSSRSSTTTHSKIFKQKVVLGSLGSARHDRSLRIKKSALYQKLWRFQIYYELGILACRAVVPIFSPKKITSVGLRTQRYTIPSLAASREMWQRGEAVDAVCVKFRSISNSAQILYCKYLASRGPPSRRGL